MENRDAENVMTHSLFRTARRRLGGRQRLFRPQEYSSWQPYAPKEEIQKIPAVRVGLRRTALLHSRTLMGRRNALSNMPPKKSLEEELMKC